MTEKILLQTILSPSDQQTVTPVWLMRQAGRYLPEYQQIRKSVDSFLTCCYTPSLAAEITLQPIRRFDLDAAIIFSDILVIPDALGIKVRFEESKGPVLDVIHTPEDIHTLALCESTLEPVYEAIQLVKNKLPVSTSLIGFAGAPWTLAAYMLEGRSSQGFLLARQWAYRYPQAFTQLLTLLEDTIVTHLLKQVDAGCDAVQLFDSWAGILNEDEILSWSLEPLRRVIARFKAAAPQVPVICFPRGVGVHYELFANQVGADVISVDQFTPLAWLSKRTKTILQGNLDPVLLATDLDKTLQKTQMIKDAMHGRPFIFNLGHGVLPFTPVEHVEALIRQVRK